MSNEGDTALLKYDTIEAKDTSFQATFWKDAGMNMMNDA